jgi:sensor histidine kinase YesM
MKRRYIVKWVGIALVVLVATVLFYLDRMRLQGQPFLKVYAIQWLYTVVVWEVNLKIILYIRRLYPSMGKMLRRILTEFSILVFSIALMVLVITGLLDAVKIWDVDVPLRHYLFDYAVILVSILFLTGIEEAAYMFREWRKTILESEQIKRTTLQTQLDSLKNQVNPHFLFNSLNSLSSLIEEDDQKALSFVDELAYVYRYLLQTNTSELTSLNNELAFIEAYFYLLKTRFGKGISLDIQVSDAAKLLSIPPMTLQLLIENAAKHNITAQRKPLQIQIFDKEIVTPSRDGAESTKGGFVLTVANNLQKKQSPVASNRMGLANISKQYALLSHQAIAVEETAETFKVVLPLI